MATPKQMVKLMQIFCEVPTEQLQDVLESGFLADLRDANISQINREDFRRICGLISKSSVTHTSTITVDETKTVEDLTAEGKYKWSNSDVTSEKFPRPENGTRSERKIALFHFGKEMTSEQVIAEMDKEGFRQATIHELLALGIAQPELQKDFPIISLGSVCVLNGRRLVAILYENAGYRGLRLSWFDLGWSGHCRFVGVRK